ncbi:WD-repeat protein [Kwoniella heveanensis BCC8398]|uniref:WD40 repeat-containing protein SMU1 n=1 Tax=Kwoniella heveanensis BCC8398 TaxID=1296120 RepID=A0A1B9GZP1_9TREE|nr:WD-repeat protein [Kwoniella heveanensis BCC8398]
MFVNTAAPTNSQAQASASAGPSRSIPSLSDNASEAQQQQLVEQREMSLTPRQREKAPVRLRRNREVELDDIRLDETVSDQEIDLLISQYLENRGSPYVAQLWNEQVLGLGMDISRKEQIEDVERAILDGDYGSIEALISKPGLLRLQTQKAFLYLCYRQQFLEHVENRESQKAFNLLQKRLKPLEHYQPVPYDFYSLSYLTSASTVHDAPTFRDWAGVGPERERLTGTWRELMGSERGDGRNDRYVPPDRLKTLLRQAAAWQVSQIDQQLPDKIVKLPTLLTDYRPLLLPSRLLFRHTGHAANVKCVGLIGKDGRLGVSGSSDSTLRIFSTEQSTTTHVLAGHTSRIWSVDTLDTATIIASGSGDGTVRLWDMNNGECKGVLWGDGGDVYSVKWRPGRDDQVVTASYDRILRSWDIEAGKQVRTFSGHSQSTLAVAFDYTGNTIASGSKDKHIRLWDAVGGVCIKNITGCLGEITSVEFDQEGRYLLAGCKDNSNRLWDLRMQRNLYRYTGHQNTSKNLIRCSFAHNASLVVGGSEDGCVYIWEREGGAHDGSVKQQQQQQSSGLLAPNLIDTTPGAAAITPSSSPIPTAGAGVSVSVNPSATAASAAYYPPRSMRAAPVNHSTSGGINVRPLKVLEGHGEGAVFDVAWKDGTDKMISAGEDGIVGVWG